MTTINTHSKLNITTIRPDNSSIRILNIHYLRDDVSAEMATFYFADELGFLPEVPESDLPEDGEAALFNKIGDALDVSHVQMTRYMTAANTAQ